MIYNTNIKPLRQVRVLGNEDSFFMIKGLFRTLYFIGVILMISFLISGTTIPNFIVDANVMIVIAILGMNVSFVLALLTGKKKGLGTAIGGVIGFGFLIWGFVEAILVSPAMNPLYGQEKAIIGTSFISVGMLFLSNLGNETTNTFIPAGIR